jgi:hypothetical protein
VDSAVPLTVWTGCWGPKYPDVYARRLARGVRRNLRLPYRFRVLSDRRLRGLLTTPLERPWAGWWHKLTLFALDEPGTNVWIDVDSVIVGDLTDLICRYSDARLAMPANWARSGHGGCQSSLMIWRGWDCAALYDDFDYARDAPRLHGDQEWITERWGSPGAGLITAIEHPACVSYKYHCRDEGRPPAGARVVTFHGEPKPHQVPDEWVRRCWR